jgi:hypothetical protein
MQIHNHGAEQTVMAYNNWGSNAGGVSNIGIGSNIAGEPDWTFSGSVASGPAPEIFSHPCDREVAAGSNVTFAVGMLGAGPFTYQWRCNGVPLAGRTLPWLELSSVSSADVAAYDVVVTGANLVSVTSLSALLTLTGSPPTAIELWRIANGFHRSDGSAPGDGDLEDRELDSLANLLEFGFGTDPNLSDNGPLAIDGSVNGTPIATLSFDAGVNFDMVFVRRDDHGQPGSLNYIVQFSSDLATFHDSTAIPTLVIDSTDDPAYEIVKVPYPLFTPDGKKARFSRVKVELVP